MEHIYFIISEMTDSTEKKQIKATIIKKNRFSVVAEYSMSGKKEIREFAPGQFSYTPYQLPIL